MNRTYQSLCFSALVFIWPVLAFSQAGGDAYPAKTVTIINAAVPGGSTEAEMRLYTQKISDSTGRPFVIDFKPGAGGTIGVAYVAKSAPDGYTLLLADGNFTSAPAFYKELPYDAARDFASISLISKRPTVLMIHPSLPIKTATEYFAFARANPGKLNFGTVGAGSTTHMNGAWMHSAAKVMVTFVHYKGTGAMMPDLLAGRIHATAITFLSSLPHIKAEKMRALGITTSERSKLWPELPTVEEQGAPGYDYSSWIGIVAPAKTPTPIIEKLNAELAKATQDPGINKKLTSEFVQIVASTPDQASRFFREDVDRWRRMADVIGVKEAPQ